MNVLILTQYYPPETGAPQIRLSELANGLKAQGFNVQVLTAMPNYPQGKVFKGYQGLRTKEILNDIPVTRTWIIPNQKTALIPRMANYVSFLISSLLLGIWELGKLDYVLTESPPLFLGITGFLISRIKKAKWIFNVSDLWPESAVRLRAIKPGLALTLSKMLEAFFYRKAWLVTGQSREIIANILHRFPTTRTYHLSNGVDARLFSPSNASLAVKKPFARDSEIIFFYGGLHGLAQGLDQILFAAQSFPVGVRFVFVGDGSEKGKLKSLAADLFLENVAFLDPVPKEQMPRYLASADVAIIPLRTRLPGAVPSKLYEAMAAGKPVILIAEGEAAEIVMKHQSGLVVQPGDISGIEAAVRRLAEDADLRHRLGQNGRNAVMNLYLWKDIINEFITFLLEN